MAHFKDIVIDSVHPAALARFWAAALDGYAVLPYDDAEIARLAALGLTPETDTNVKVAGPGPTLCCHLINPPRHGGSRLHLDMTARDRSAEIKRLEALGATPQREGNGYTVMADPEGNRFCVFDEV
jgi:hypothetical protein